MAYTTIDDPAQFFNVKIYAPDGSSSFAVTGVGFQPDWVWLKSRSYAEDHQLNDSVRGATKGLQANLTNAEATQSNGLTSFDSDGFTVGNLSDYNYNGDSIVSWNWKAGTSFTNDASATSIGSIDSSGSVNETAGFSICTYTGVSSAGTIKHGLSTVPSMIIWKNRSASNGWIVYHHGNTSAPETDYLELHSTNSTTDLNTIMNDTAPTSSVFSIGTEGAVGGSNTNNFVSYIFSERKGYSKFGKYRGNGDANGPFVYLGFRPIWCMFRNTAGDKWSIYDAKRSPFNVVDDNIRANQSNAEVDQANKEVDFLSNGIKIRTSSGEWNGDGNDIIFFAFAESPFVNSKGTPTNAR